MVEGVQPAGAAGGLTKGMDFGSLRVGAESKYQLAKGCSYRYGAMSVTSGKQSFHVFPIDFVGEAPLSPGYYTHALTTEPASDPRFPGGIHSQISKDSAPSPAK